MILIKNVTVVSSKGRELRDVSLEGPDEVIDGMGKFLLPGMVDPHVHFRDPGAPEKEDFASGSAAALSGGVTTVLDMPNTNPATITVEALEAKRATANAKSAVHFGLFFGATRDNLDEMRRAQNICGIKIYMGSSTGNLLLDDPAVWEEVFKIAKEKDVPVVVHAETESMIAAGKRDCECARVATEAAIALREKIGNRLHIAHLSCKAEVELVRQHKHPLLSCEATLHHLLFTAADQKDAFLKMNPPLRSQVDQDALWEGLKDGTIDCIATDHAPHTVGEKQSANPPAGVPGVEFVFPLILTAALQGRLTLEQVAALTSENAARIFKLAPKDWVLVEPVQKTLAAADIRSKCGWSPYLEHQILAWPSRIFIQS